MTGAADGPRLSGPGDSPGWQPGQESLGWGPFQSSVASAPSGASTSWIRRYGPGIPTDPALVAGPGPTAEQVWRSGLPADPPRRPGRLGRLAGTALTVVLLIASGVVIYLRLHHPALGVTAVAITGQQKDGCATDVTGRIDTTGGAGIVSYEWVFTPQLVAPQPLRQSVDGGQTSVYVTASVQGQGHGQLTQRVTLQVLGPGQRSAAANVVISC